MSPLSSACSPSRGRWLSGLSYIYSAVRMRDAKCCRSTYAGGCECKVVLGCGLGLAPCSSLCAGGGSEGGELGIWIWGGAQGDDRRECSRVAPADNGRCRQASQSVLSRVEGELRYHGVVLWPLGELYVSDAAGVEEHHLGNAIAGLAPMRRACDLRRRLNRRTVISRVVVGGWCGVGGGGCLSRRDDEQRQQRKKGEKRGGCRVARCTRGTIARVVSILVGSRAVSSPRESVDPGKRKGRD